MWARVSGVRRASHAFLTASVLMWPSNMVAAISPSDRRKQTMPKQILMILAIVGLLLPGSVLAIPTTIDFESLSDSDSVTIQISGLTFSHTTVLTAGISLNEFEFPPHSGANVVFDDGGPITIGFATLQDSVSGFFTYLHSLTFTAFDTFNNVVGTPATSAFLSNLALSGNPGSSPNELLGVTSLT